MPFWVRKRRRDEDLDEEIRAHLAMAAHDRTERGESHQAAHDAARRELGNELLIREVTREMWGWTMLERLAQDVKYVLRQMRRSPGFTVVAILTLALGLGATTAMFSIVNSVLLEPLKYREPGRLYLARAVALPSFHLSGDYPVNARQFHEWRTNCRSCEDLSLFQYAELTLVGVGQPTQLPGLATTSNFFRTLGIQPALGRDFVPEDEHNWGVVLLSDRLWRTRFAADPSVIGRTVQLNGEPHTVIGVMPPDLHVPRGTQWAVLFGPDNDPLIFRPSLGGNAARERAEGNMNYNSLIRLKPGVSRGRAMDEINALQAEFVRQYQLGYTITLLPLQDQVTRGARSPLWLLLAAIGVVMLIVCVNVANLMLVRTAGRYREAGVRMALGAGRARLFGLALTESVVLVAIAGVLGLGLAWAGLRAFVAAAPIELPRLDEAAMDWRVLAFGFLVTACSAALCGVFPAWRLARTEPLESLKAGSSQSTETGRKLRLRELMVSVEVAMSTVLLIAAALLLFSFVRLLRVDKGFEPAHVVTQDVSFLNPKYNQGGRRRFVEELLLKFERIPGVQAAGATNLLPLRGEDWIDGLRDPDRPEPAPGEVDESTNHRFIAPGYFQALGIPAKQGRFLEAMDRNRPVAVISERVAQTLWPGRSPLGRHVRGAGTRPSLEVVGVVGEVPANGLDQTPPMVVYEHYWRMQPIGMSLVVRTQADPASTAVAMRAILAEADPELALPPTQAMEQIVGHTLAARRFEMYLAVAFAGVALALASLGIYGVISFSVARRTPEMGIRIALGARTTQLMAMILHQGMRPVVVGLVAGSVVAWPLRGFIAGELFGVAPSDPSTLTAVSIVLLTVAACACWIPARRASKIDPLRALRFE